MQFLLAFYHDDRQIPLEAVEQAFLSDARFTNVRHHTPVGTVIESDFEDAERQEWSIVRLDEKRTALSMTRTTYAAFAAAWILHQHVTGPLHLVNDDNDFDLNDFASADELWSAALAVWER